MSGIELIDNPAKFSQSILDEMRPILSHEAKIFNGISVLDPFAGTGKIHSLARPKGTLPAIRTVGVELEPEWAEHHPDTEVGNALDLRWRADSFDVIATSPVYGNRMSDHHNAQERCKPCGATGSVPVTGQGRDGFEECEKCNGSGRREYKRNTYKHTLGRDLSEGSAAVLQWGPSQKAIKAYQDFHVAAWTEARRVLRPKGLFVLNISNHIRTIDGEAVEIPVSEWHRDTIIRLGFTLLDDIHIETPRNGMGANRDVRVEYEHIYVLRAIA